MTHAFYELEHYAERTALLWRGEEISYAVLANKADQLVEPLADSNKLVFLLMGNDPLSIAAYLGCLRHGHCALLLSPDIDGDKLTKLRKIYQPDAIIDCNGLQLLSPIERPSPAGDMALLLSTSGSTGSAKLVALSASNLRANTASIAEYLPIQECDVAITSLPLHYSYGLSVLNTHLMFGAAVVLTDATVMQRDFWDAFERHRVTTLAGVPHSYQLLERLRFFDKDWPSIRYVTQAGGRLARRLVERTARWADQHGKAFYVMYGQTEATARMAYLDWPGALHKPDAVGKAIPGGKLQLRDESGQVLAQVDTEGELFYTGENVMLGYVSNPEDFSNLARPGWLATGDLAMMDEQGDFSITGRKKRIVKLFGERLSLDEIEHWLHTKNLNAACIGKDDFLKVLVADCGIPDDLRMQIALFSGIHHSAIQIVNGTEIPRLQNGKVDYAAIENWLEHNR